MTPEQKLRAWELVHAALCARPDESIQSAALRVQETGQGRVDVADIVCPRVPQCEAWRRLEHAAEVATGRPVLVLVRPR